MELKQKGTSAQLGAFKQLKVSLIWTAPVDLDLMAFYKTKDGQTGGVYSDNYSGGGLGDLNAFPFIQLSGDAGVGATGGDKQEELRVTKLDDLAELYIVALNFTDASSGASRVFSQYDARVEVVNDRGEQFVVPLDSDQPGPVAVICKFAAGFIANELVNDSQVMSLEAFRQQIPGADKLKLASKITLKSKGDSFDLKPKAGTGAIHINLNWNQEPAASQEGGGFFSKVFGAGKPKGIDLDLGCLFEMRVEGIKGSIQPLGNAFGDFENPPFIQHAGDDRTGAWSQGENMKINLARIDMLKRVLIYTYIYEGVPNWAQTDGVVTVTVPGQPELEVRMGQQSDSRPFCAIAMLEFEDKNIKVRRLASFHQGHEDCDRSYGWGLNWVAGRK